MVRITAARDIQSENQRMIPEGSEVTLVGHIMDDAYEIEYMGETYIVHSDDLKRHIKV